MFFLPICIRGMNFREGGDFKAGLFMESFALISYRIFVKRGLPGLYLTVDIMDRRHTSEAEVNAKITEFFKSHGWA